MAGKDGKDGGDKGDFILAVLQAFQQDCVVQQLQKIFKSSIAPLEDALRQMNETNAALRRQIADRDETIGKLEVRVTELELKSDDNEQQGRKGSIRIFGLPEQGQGTLERKLMRLCNDHLKLQPPICENDIDVAHRLGKPPPNPQPHDESNDPPPPPPPQMLILEQMPRLATPVFVPGLSSWSWQVAGQKDISWTRGRNWRTIPISRTISLTLFTLETTLPNVWQPWLSELGN